jgi:predicted transposase YbfD/YdcC
MAPTPIALCQYLDRLPDPRIDRCKRHRLLDIVTMALCAVLGGADTWPQVATFARRRQDWFKRFLELPNGIPSHHTFRRVFDRLAPQPLQRALVAWLHHLSEMLGVKHIAIDGKTLRHSGGGASSLDRLHLVSAWATEANLTLGQVAVQDKSNEITAIPLLLELLDLKGAWVTLDAMGCQKDIARQIVEGGGDYVLTVKGNQERLRDDIVDCFVRTYDADCRDTAYTKHETVEESHGRHERRIYEVIAEPTGIRGRQAWPKLRVIGKCYSERTVNGKTSCEERYFIGSRRCQAKRYGEILRNHWRIENNLHWQLDVTFGEDASRICSRHGGENIALLRRLALGLLKGHPGKASIPTKRYEASLDVAFLEEVLKQGPKLGKL